jgi:23S rRNA U2552 (ribose-2'-O)-methylase RlmE/FtsJ
LNKTGFHEDFKPLRVLAAGAKIYKVMRLRDKKEFVAKAFSKKGFDANPKSREALLNEIKIMRLVSSRPH